MNTVTLGRTGITSPQNAFGALPIQRVSDEYAVMLLQKAYRAGFTFFDTARSYSDSERKLGMAFVGMRDKIVIATKTGARTAEGFWRDLETSLAMLGTDYIDIYQLHNPPFCPRPGDESGLYDAMLEAKRQGKIRFISTGAFFPQVLYLEPVLNEYLHKLACVVNEAVKALSDTIVSPYYQPFSWLPHVTLAKQFYKSTSVVMKTLAENCGYTFSFDFYDPETGAAKYRFTK